MKNFGFVLLLVTATALIKPSGGEGEEKDWKRFMLQWRQHPSFPLLLLDGDLADKLWFFCLRHMVGAEEILGTVLRFASDEISSRSSENSLKTMLFLELLTLLPPETLSIACDCISANYLSLGIPQEFCIALTTYLENQQSLIGLNYYPRRQLVDQPVEDSASMPRVRAPPMSSGDEPQFSQSVTKTPFTPSNSLNIEPPNQPHHGRPAQKHRGVPPPVSPLEKRKDYIKLVLIAVLPTAAVSFTVAFLIFYCCGCNKSKVSVSEQRDDHPLLHMQLATPGSSPDVRNPTSPFYNDDQRCRHRPSKSGASMSHCFTCWFKRSTDATPSSQVTGEIPGNNASSDAPKPMPPPPPPPPPPLPPKAPPLPPRPPRGSKPRLAQPSPVESSRSEGSSAGEQTSESSETEVNVPRAKLRPFYWDKVLANPDQSMAWHDIKFGSFHVNEDMIEELFGYNARSKNNLKDKELNVDPSPQHISLLNVKKSCNLAVVFKAMNIRVQDIHDALIEGNELPPALLETILRMKPTDEEEQKLRFYDGDFAQLGLAEQVMKALLDIPFAFKRINTLLFMSSLQEDASTLRDSFLQLEAACGELKHRLFLKLLEAVLKTGNRLNDGTFHGGANAFKLDTLLKLSDVKGADGKTTLLHFVVQEIVRSEGVREARLAMESEMSPRPSTSDDNSNESPQDGGDYYSHRGLEIISGLSSEMDNVKKVAAFDAEALSASVSTLRHELTKAKEVLSEIATLEETSGFHHMLEQFVENADNETKFLLSEEKRLRSLVKKTIRYFHGNDAKDDGFRLFVVVRDFLMMLDKACKEVGTSQKKAANKSQSNSNCQPNPQQGQFPAVLDDHLDGSDSND